MAKTDKQKVGDWGEDIACRFLERKGYTILARNVREKWGEIDVICSKQKIVPRGTMGDKYVPRGTILSRIKSFFAPKHKKHPQIYPQEQPTLVFIEVKTLQTAAFNPAESVTPAKQKRIIRSCQAYIRSQRLPQEIDWQIDVIGIIVDKKRNRARVEHLEQAVYY